MSNATKLYRWETELTENEKKQKTYIDQKSNTLGKVYTVRKNKVQPGQSQ